MEVIFTGLEKQRLFANIDISRVLPAVIRKLVKSHICAIWHTTEAYYILCSCMYPYGNYPNLYSFMAQRQEIQTLL